MTPASAATPRFDLIALYNRTYSRWVRLFDIRGTHLDFEGSLIEAHDMASAHVTAVAKARNLRIHSLGIPMFEQFALRMTPTTMAGAWQAQAKRVTCGRCAGTGMTPFTWRERGVCFKCEGSGDSAHPYARVVAA